MITRIGLGDFPNRLKTKFTAKEFAMFDSVTISMIPGDAAAVAGYVNGHWPTFAELAKSHPHAKRLSVAISADADAECLDVERGDATPDQVPAWISRQLRRGVTRPVVYCAVSTVKQLLDDLGAAGIKRSSIRLWTAHYTGNAHRCTQSCGFGMPTTADATQWTSGALERNLDQSLCAPDFL
jgi:hypothetical protein